VLYHSSARGSHLTQVFGVSSTEQRRNFQTLIYTLCLAIRLRVIGRANFQFSLQQFEQFSPEGASKYSISVQDIATENIMQLDSVV
jgi:hypothetical protein